MKKLQIVLVALLCLNGGWMIHAQALKPKEKAKASQELPVPGPGDYGNLILKHVIVESLGIHSAGGGPSMLMNDGRISFFDKDRATRMSIALRDDGSPSILFYAPRAKPGGPTSICLEMSTTASGDPQVGFVDGKGQTRMMFSLSEGNCVQFRIRDSENRSRIKMGETDAGKFGFWVEGPKGDVLFEAPKE